jgi:hypothetical protein
MVVPKLGHQQRHQSNRQQNASEWHAPKDRQLSAIKVGSQSTEREQKRCQRDKQRPTSQEIYFHIQPFELKQGDDTAPHWIIRVPWLTSVSILFARVITSTPRHWSI